MEDQSDLRSSLSATVLNIIVETTLEKGILQAAFPDSKHPVNTLPFPKQALVFKCLQYTSLEDTVGKGEIARNEQFFSISHSVFYPFLRIFRHFHQP